MTNTIMVWPGMVGLSNAVPDTIGFGGVVVVTPELKSNVARMRLKCSERQASHLGTRIGLRKPLSVIRAYEEEFTTHLVGSFFLYSAANKHPIRRDPEVNLILYEASQ
jgi:hypothetical protein